jgi:predicted nucleotide-binding protein
VAINKKVAGPHEPKSSKRTYVKQSDIPKLTLSEALRLPQSIADDFGRQPTAPHQLAMSVDVSPTSSNWRDLCGASIAYGLTEGGYNANQISLTELGKKIVAPTEDGQDCSARVEAALRPSVMRRFFDKYNKAKFPQEKIARNVLIEMGAPAPIADKVLEILKRNGESVGIIHQTKTGPFIAVDAPRPPTVSGGAGPLEFDNEDTATDNPAVERAGSALIQSPAYGAKSSRVFITHGKNKVIVEQLKQLLTFGKFEPVVAEEHETTSAPVPDKVLEEMRGCFAGVIHVAGEEELLDKAGAVHHKINENVLIEIGAAMALYGRNFILLVQRGIHLPSNLQGLYRCEYEGEKLDYDATMKLLKAFNEFK